MSGPWPETDMPISTMREILREDDVDGLRAVQFIALVLIETNKRRYGGVKNLGSRLATARMILDHEVDS